MTLAVSALFRPRGRRWRLVTAGTKHSERSKPCSLSLSARCGRTVLAISGVRWGALLSAGLVVGLSATDACGHDGDALAGVVRCADDRGCRRRPAGRCHCRCRNTVVLLLPPVSLTEIRERGDPQSARSSMRPCWTS